MRHAGFGSFVVDLLLGGRCAGCAAEAGMLCSTCRAALRGPLRLVNRPHIDVPVLAAAEYTGAVVSVVLAHKERGRLALARPLGDALAAAVAGLVVAYHPAGGISDRIALVPVPSARATTRRRGHEPLVRTSRRAAAELRRRRIDSVVVPALRHRRTVSDQAGLGRALRVENMAGSMALRRRAATALAAGRVVIVDDVVTTGATFAEAVRALRAAGVPVHGGAVIANATAGRTGSRHTAASRWASR